MIDAFDIYFFGLLLNLKGMFEDLMFFLVFSSLILTIVVPMCYDFNIKALNTPKEQPKESF